MKVNYLKSFFEIMEMQLFFVVLFFFFTFTGVNIVCLFWKVFTWGLFYFTFGMVFLSAIGYGLSALGVRCIEAWENRER